MNTPPIQRYDMYLDGAGVRVGKSKEGEYVTHDDHVAAILVVYARAEKAEAALLQYRNPLLWPSPIQPPYIATCQTGQLPEGDTQ